MEASSFSETFLSTCVATRRHFSLKPALHGAERDADGRLKKLIAVAAIVKWTEFVLIWNLCLGRFPIISVL